jgi:hypothetical protein
MTEAQAIALAGAIFGAIYAAIQIGDRLWGHKLRREPRQLEQFPACKVDHSELRATLALLVTSQNQLTATTTQLSQAIMQLIADRHAERQVSEARHLELIRVLTATRCEQK